MLDETETRAGSAPTGYGNPSKAYTAVIGKPGNGWYYWLYRDHAGEYRRVDGLRQEYRDRVSRTQLGVKEPTVSKIEPARMPR